MTFGWRFPILDGGKRQGINDSGVATFAGEELYNNLAREICQNSLDAWDSETNEPVIVCFSLKSMSKKIFSPLLGLKKTLDSCKEYWNSYEDKKLNCFLNNAFDTIEKEQLDILIISDYNTVGLNGSKNRSGAWDALTGSDGVSYKPDGSQGSFGIGKKAPYACSNLRTVFYNTYSKMDNIKAFQGVTSLVTHLNDNNEETQGCGFYYNIEERCPIFEGDDCDIIRYFNREKFGTDIIVVGFKKSLNWAEDMKLAIIKNFFIAIINKQLIVKIDDLIIDSKTIFTLIKNAIKNNPNDNVLIKVNNYCETYIEPDKIFNFEIIEKDDAKLHIKMNDQFTRSIAHVRATGMLIKQRTIKKMMPYSAVLFIDGVEINKLLKLMEPPKHDKWDPDMLDDARKSYGRNMVNKINKLVASSIESMCKLESVEEIDPDGVSLFLPDETDFINQKGDTHDRILENPLMEIENLRKEKPLIFKQNSNEKELQTDMSEEKNTNSKANNEEHNRQKVASDQEDTKQYNKNVEAKLRIVPLQSENGIYNFIIISENNYSDAIFVFNRIGEDGGTESVKIMGIIKGGKFEKLNQSHLRINNLKKGETKIVTVKLDLTDRTLFSVGGVGNEIDK